MVAPAVNEEVPREPVKAELAQAEPADTGPVRQAERTRSSADGEPEAELADGEPAEAELADGEPAEAEPAETELAETELPKRSCSGAAAADAELAGADAPGWDAAQEHRDVSPLAVAGIILGILALVGAAVGVLAVITHGFRPKTVITYRPAAVFGLRPGECINSAGNGLDVTVRSCATPHDAEVFATFSLPPGTWPGASAVQQDAGNGCASRLEQLPEPAARDGRPDPGIRLPEPGRVAGRRADRGMRGQRGQRAAHWFGARAGLIPAGFLGGPSSHSPRRMTARSRNSSSQTTRSASRPARRAPMRWPRPSTRAGVVLAAAATVVTGTPAATARLTTSAMVAVEPAIAPPVPGGGCRAGFAVYSEASHSPGHVDPHRPEPVAAIRHPGGRHRVGDQDQPIRPGGASHQTDHGVVQVHAVGDHLAGDLVPVEQCAGWARARGGAAAACR